jgi:hypothetical protein
MSSGRSRRGGGGGGGGRRGSAPTRYSRYERSLYHGKQDIISFFGTCFVHKFEVVNGIYKSFITCTVLESMLEKSGLA